jgi:hypothetical protein
MQIIESVHFNKAEWQVMKDFARWHGHKEELILNEKELKLISRLVNDPQGWTYGHLDGAIEILSKIRNTVTNKKNALDNVRRVYGFPEESTGIIMRPAMMAEALAESYTEALKSIDRILILFKIAKDNVKKPSDLDPYEMTGEDEELALDPDEASEIFQGTLVRR